MESISGLKADRTEINKQTNNGGWGRGSQEVGDMCIHTADSRFCITETNMTLLSNYTSI